MKIGIIGSGLVGATAAYAMVMRGVGREVVLVDLNKERASAEADDIFHAVPFAHPVSVRDGDYTDLAGCRVVVITAGVGQRPGESRRDLLGRNAAVFHSIVPQILRAAPEAILLVASNPVDVMTHLTARYAAEFGLPGSRVLGTGTTLDTARFRVLLGRCLGVDAQHVHAYVLGEHGDSEVLTWSLATVGGSPLDEYCEMERLTLCSGEREQIDEQVRKAAYHIIAGKGATYYGVGSAIARIVEAILKDQRAILTICSPLAEVAGVNNVTLSLPHLVGGEGVLNTLYPPVDEEEARLLRLSAEVVAADIALLD
jgi:L-lactate dehydrogenase